MTISEINLFPTGWRAKRILDQLSELETCVQSILPQEDRKGIQPTRSSSRSFAEELILASCDEATTHIADNPTGAVSFLLMTYTLADGLRPTGLDILPEPPESVGGFSDLCLWYLGWLDKNEKGWLAECVADDTYGFCD